MSGVLDVHIPLEQFASPGLLAAAGGSCPPRAMRVTGGSQGVPRDGRRGGGGRKGCSQIDVYIDILIDR